jgi:AcrR family transcriptional regulator
MCARPRKVSDDEVFGAAHRIMARLGPAQWTLTDIAVEAGLTAGALVQRFGSKRRLLIALTEQVASATPLLFAQLRASHPQPLDALRAFADCIAQMGESPGALAHHLAYLQLDLTDPDLHRQVRAQASATRAALRGLIEDAVAAGELAATVDPAALARAVECILSGSLLTWAFYQDGPAVTWVQHDLNALLQPFRRSRRKRRRRAAGRGGSNPSQSRST